jgi:hypothetical protein
MSLDINLTGVEKTSNKKTNLTDNSDTFYPTQKAVKTAVDLKVDKVTGKGLSENDFTNTLKTKLDGIQAGAEVNVNADWNATSGDAQILNKPTIPNPSDFVAKSDFTSHSILAKQSGASDPVAVSIGNNEILGRKSGGGSNIEGLSVSDVKSILNYTASDVGAVATNSAITGATKTKITYDAKGLVTTGADATTADIADSSNKRYVTDAQRDSIAVSGTIIVTSGTSFTTPSNITTATKFDIILVGGGGGGAGINTSNTTAGGGGGGAVCQVLSLTGLTASTSYTCAIGAGGAGGASATNGTDGGDTTLTIGATTYTAEGGGGGLTGAGAPLGGDGGTATNGTRNLTGQKGMLGINGGTLLSNGRGGDAPLGQGFGGIPTTSNNSNGNNATNNGGGGGGAKGLASVGGNGTNGIIIAKYYS